MQILNLDADLNISRLDADIRTLRLGEGGTTNYNELTNKPSINSVTLTGNKTTSDLNIKTSDLINDEGFITNADIPTKTSDLTNDSGFQTAAQVSSAVEAAIPTNVSAFTNDAGYITAAQVGNIPTKTSDLTNDSGFITSAEAPVQSVNSYTGAVSLDGSNLDYSAALSINDKIDAVEAAIPTKTSDLTNDSGFITSAGVPSKTSDLINDSGFITSADIPTDVSAFTNDAGYQTAADVNSLIQAAMPVTETIENESIASFSDGAHNVPVSELIVNITATQEGSGVPAPDNERVVHGWSNCNIHKSGINLWDEEWEIGGINWITGANSSETDRIRSKNYIPVLPNTDYYMASPAVVRYVWFYDANKNIIENVSGSNNFIQLSPINFNFTTPYNACYCRFITWTTYGTTYNNDISINYPSTDTSYHAYNGTTYPISLGDTYYGGTLNVTTGELTKEKGYLLADGSEDWQVSGSGDSQIFYLNINDMESGTNLDGLTNYIKNFSGSTAELCIRFGYGSTYIFIYSALTLAGVSDLASFKDYLSNEPLQIVYPLATPTTVQLTPTEVRTLLEDNNIFADTGDVNKLVYFKTGCEAIARLIEAYT